MKSNLEMNSLELALLPFLKLQILRGNFHNCSFTTLKMAACWVPGLLFLLLSVQGALSYWLASRLTKLTSCLMFFPGPHIKTKLVCVEVFLQYCN